MYYYINRPLGYERIYLPLDKVADTPDCKCIHGFCSRILRLLSETYVNNLKLIIML